jgi:hypothetical protein
MLLIVSCGGDDKATGGGTSGAGGTSSGGTSSGGTSSGGTSSGGAAGELAGEASSGGTGGEPVDGAAGTADAGGGADSGGGAGGRSGGTSGGICADFVGSCTWAAGRCRDIGGVGNTALFAEDSCKAPSSWSTSPCTDDPVYVAGCKYTGAPAALLAKDADCRIEWFSNPIDTATFPLLCPGATEVVEP